MLRSVGSTGVEDSVTPLLNWPVLVRGQQVYRHNKGYRSFFSQQSVYFYRIQYRIPTAPKIGKALLVKTTTFQQCSRQEKWYVCCEYAHGMFSVASPAAKSHKYTQTPREPVRSTCTREALSMIYSSAHDMRFFCDTYKNKKHLVISEH